MKEYYELLDLTESATDEEITARYETLKEKYKEDRWLDGEAGNEAARKLTQIEMAYRELMASRKEQDKNTDGKNTSSIFPTVRTIGGANNFVLFNRHTSWSEGGLRMSAVKAEHSDPTPIGVIIDDGDKKYYVTGDTLYNEDIFADIPDDIYAVFLPVNGAGNNMNMTDAARFVKASGAKLAVPLHCGLFDSLNLHDFPTEEKVVPNFYKEIELK